MREKFEDRDTACRCRPDRDTTCPCRRKNCPRHGKCRECRAYHEKNRKYRPFCERGGEQDKSPKKE